MSSSSTSTSQSSTAAPACQTPAGAKQTVAIHWQLSWAQWHVEVVGMWGIGAG
jgi:hypothetical protein